MDKAEAKRRLKVLHAEIAGFEKKLAPHRARIQELHGLRGQAEEACLAIREVRGFLEPRKAEEAKALLTSAWSEIQSAEGATKDDEEQLAALHRQKIALERFHDLVEPEHIEQVMSARPHTWDWPVEEKGKSK